ncbi:MAG TPA: hypothetical protein PKY64_05010 [Anaerolineaceae bacterium]|nr:hypothetical protein [Anaerolineaceae bacterium]
MERTVPIRSSEEIDLYLRTIYSLLRSSNEVHIRTLEEVHAGMNSSLHTKSREDAPDISALLYALQRLPEVIISVKKVILGQSAENLASFGYGDIETWQEVSAKARRRRCFYDGGQILACYIASRSDIDDVVPALTTLQIEWNKLHFLLNTLPEGLLASAKPDNTQNFHQLARHLQIKEEELARLYTLMGDNFHKYMSHIASETSDLTVQLVSGSLNDYRKATESWWTNIESQVPAVTRRPIYFVSSNTHSLANLLSGFSLTKRAELINFIQKDEPSLLAEWEEIQLEANKASQENFFYYAMRAYLSAHPESSLAAEQIAFEEDRGITRLSSVHSFDVEASVMELHKLNPNTIDPRLVPEGDSSHLAFLQDSDAIILNIDYPLGFAAYNLLTKIAENSSKILGIYIMGKAASLNGVRGDVVLPNVVYDEHSRNTYLFNNNFTAADIAPNLNFGTVLDNQKAVSVMGTFLQNRNVLDVVYREGYTDVEMEAGPYLSAIYELFRPQRHPVNEIVNLHGVPFDLGILHYVSDTPYSKGKNLGAGGLSYFGMDSTYAVSVAILKRIISMEKRRIDPN